MLTAVSSEMTMKERIGLFLGFYFLSSRILLETVPLSPSLIIASTIRVIRLGFIIIFICAATFLSRRPIKNSCSLMGVMAKLLANLQAPSLANSMLKPIRKSSTFPVFCNIFLVLARRWRDLPARH